MRILFITSNRLGDAVLSLGILEHFAKLYPKAKFSVACGELAAEIFAHQPCVHDVFVLKKQRHSLHWIKLWAHHWYKHFTLIIDLRNTAISRLFLRKELLVANKNFVAVHKTAELAKNLNLDVVPLPKIYLNKDIIVKASEYIPDGEKVIIIGPTANWIGKTWDRENYIKLAHTLITDERYFPNYKVAILASAHEHKEAYAVYSALPADKRVCSANG